MDLDLVENELLSERTFEANEALINYYNDLDDVYSGETYYLRASTIKIMNKNFYTIHDKIQSNSLKFMLTDDNAIIQLLNISNYNGGKFKQIIHTEEEIGSNVYCEYYILKLEDVKKKIELLYDHLTNYVISKNRCNINEIICKSKNRELLNEIIAKYNPLNRRNSTSTDCCKEFEKCKKTYGVHKLTMCHCREYNISSFYTVGSGDAHLNREASAGSPHSQP
ncbi:hypothetical protein POWCR01_000203000 [Plasmodium ovale]|uniref:PIR protein n=1 Tax=Plasmodium ovale TaxID=36330 RepID=A0A1C3KK27_PLAOA|nr:hypothetical protein POWCR01_000203000 [Plasmodium ovale]